MSSIQSLPLGIEGLKYVQSALFDGGDGLPKELLNLPLSEGETYAVVPTGVDLPRATTFSQGGNFDFDEANWLAHHILDSSSAGVNSIVVFCDAWGARASDPGIVALQGESGVFVNGNSVYYYEATAKNSPEALIRLYRRPASFLSIGILVDVINNDLSVESDRHVSDDFLRGLAKNTLEIYIGAYDRESFVVWKRKDD